MSDAFGGGAVEMKISRLFKPKMSTISTKMIWLVQNNFGPIEEQGISHLHTHMHLNVSL